MRQLSRRELRVLGPGAPTTDRRRGRARTARQRVGAELGHVVRVGDVDHARREWLVNGCAELALVVSPPALDVARRGRDAREEGPEREMRDAITGDAFSPRAEQPRFTPRPAASAVRGRRRGLRLADGGRLSVALREARRASQIDRRGNARVGSGIREPSSRAASERRARSEQAEAFHGADDKMSPPSEPDSTRRVACAPTNGLLRVPDRKLLRRRPHAPHLRQLRP